MRLAATPASALWIDAAPLPAVADGGSTRGAVFLAAAEEGAQRRPLPAVAPTEATQASVLQSAAASAPLVDCDVSTASCSAPGGAMMLLAPALSAAAPCGFVTGFPSTPAPASGGAESAGARGSAASLARSRSCSSFCCRCMCRGCRGCCTCVWCRV